MSKLTDEQEKIKKVYTETNKRAHKRLLTPKSPKVESNNNNIEYLDSGIGKALRANHYDKLMKSYEDRQDAYPTTKPSIRPPKASKKSIAFRTTAGTVAALLLAAYAVHELKPDKPTVITPESYLSFCENTDEYTRGLEIAQKFEAFEDSLKTYQELSQNPEGLSYVDKQELEKAKEYIKRNYKNFEDIYLYQAKSKVAEAYRLPEEKLGSLKSNKSGSYASIDDDSPDDLIPRISNDGNAYFSKISGNNSSVVMPKELKNALSDIADLQKIWSEDKNFPYDEISEKYSNFLKFLSIKFEADEKGNISLSDKTYECSDEDIIAYYSPTYESLINKKSENGGKLKKSQEKRLEEVKQEMYDSLLQVVRNKINSINSVDSGRADYYRNDFMEILEQISDTKLSPMDAFPTIYNINSSLDESLNSLETKNQQSQELDEEGR